MSVRRAALIVLAWNQWPTTRRCLDSLLGTTLGMADVIVVDNGSSDETPHALAAYADRVRVVTLAQNLGFVRGMNAGIAAAAPDDDVVLLNNDLLFSQRDWLDRLRDAAYAQADFGVVGCRQLGPEADGRLYHAGGFIEADELWGQQTESGAVERDVAQYTDTRRVQGIAFALAYIRRDCLERIGVLDTAFHSYFEDTDYCLRAADAGIASIVAGRVTLQHDQHGSTRDDGGFRQRLWAASRATFSARWKERLRAQVRGNMLWRGTTRYPYAHAHLARALVRRFDARGLRMIYASGDSEVIHAEDFRLEFAAGRRWTPPADVELVCTGTLAATRSNSRRRMALAFGEWERIPAEWAQAARGFEQLIVPDAFQRDAFRAAGVDTPIEIVPIGVDHDYCHPRVPAPRDPQGRFVFLAVVEDFVRDAPDLLVDAFAAAFDAEADVALLLLIRPGREPFAIEDTLRSISVDPRIRMLTNWGFPWYQRAQLLAGADAYVSVRRGGGWDPFAAEALACGKILLATDFGSQAALAREHGFVVEARRVEDARRPGAHWAEPQRDDLIARLREIHARRDELLMAARSHTDAFARAHDIETSADRLAGLITTTASLAAPAPAPRAHRPVDLRRTASGQIIVLGMHRSGTSSVAGLLARMGVAVGPSADLLEGPDNPKGHYESGRLHMACVRRLAAAGGDWRDPPSTAPNTAVDAFRQDVGALIDEFDRQRPWLFKEPRLCLLARELLPLLTRPLFVHVVRDPVAIADSLAARDGLAHVDALALWQRYTHDSFAASDGWSRLIVDYDALCADPIGVTRALHDELVEFGIQGLQMPSAEVVREWIAPNPTRASASTLSDLTPAQRALHAAIADRSILDGARTPRAREA